MRITKNFSDETLTYTNALTDESRQRFFTIQGETLVGKTELLLHFKSTSFNTHCSCAFVNLRRSKDPHAILDVISEHLGREMFPNYEGLSREVAQRGAMFINKSFFFFSSMRASVQNTDPSAINRHLTREFFGDLARNSTDPISILIDHFEVASEDTKAWIHTDLVPRIERLNQLILTVAGQIIPVCDRDLISFYQPITLTTIHVDNWIEYADEIGGMITSDEVREIYNAVGGISGLVASKIHEVTKSRR